MRGSFAIATLVAAALGCGCGGTSATPPAAVAGDDPEAARREGPHRAGVPSLDDEEPDDGLGVEGLRAHLEPYQIQDGIRPHQRALTACYRGQLRKSRFLGGQIELAFVVATTGEVREVRMTKANLGSWAVERCLLETARAIRFAAPKGPGDADFTLPLDFDSGRGSIVWWEEAQADLEVEKLLEKLGPCDEGEGGAASDVWVTFYVGSRGRVRSVGFASPTVAVPETWADCATELMAEWALTDPRGKIAKAGFRYRPQ